MLQLTNLSCYMLQHPLSLSTSKSKTPKATEQRHKDDKKGKRTATAPKQVWKQRAITNVNYDAEKRSYKSTEDVDAPLHLQASSSGNKSSAEKKKEAVSSGASQDSISVFERLGSKNGSAGKDSGNSDKNLEGRSSKGSLSPPSVFERLGSHSTNSSER